MKSGKLNGKVSVVTGASKGIGAGIAKQFAFLLKVTRSSWREGLTGRSEANGYCKVLSDNSSLTHALRIPQ